MVDRSICVLKYSATMGYTTNRKRGGWTGMYTYIFIDTEMDILDMWLSIGSTGRQIDS